MKKTFPLVFICILFGFLLLFPTQSLTASKTGLLLWFDTLLPTLLPFLILSQLILKTPLIFSIESVLGPIFKKLFHCSESGAFCALCGFLCGYPVGARLIAVQIKEKQLSLKEGQYLLSFCNQVSPMFCVSYGILHAIGTKEILPYLLIIYGAAILFGILTRPQQLPLMIPEAKKQTPTAENIFQLIDVCIIDSFLIMIKLCGYLMLFSIVSTGILLLIPEALHWSAPFLTSILEVTNGLSYISAMPAGNARKILGVFALSFGGLCCIFQTNSVISDTDLSIKKYLFHKTATALLALFLFFLWYLFSSFAINGWR